MTCLSAVKLWLWLSALASLAGWVLSALGQLNVRGYAAFAVLSVVILWFARKSGNQASVSNSHVSSVLCCVRRARFRRALPLSFVIFSALIFIGGVLYAPNNHTALTYRIPRVLKWLFENGWYWVHTPNPRINDRACGIEWLSAPLLLLTRSDRALFLLNFIPFLLLPGLVFSVWTRLGVRARVAWHWMWLMPTGYAFLLQAGSTGNDTFPTVYALAAIDFAFRAAHSRRVSDLSYSILAAALLTGAKASNLPLLLPWAFVLIAFFADAGSKAPLFRQLPAWGLGTPWEFGSSGLDLLKVFNASLKGVLIILKRHFVAITALLLVAATVSFLPTAALNSWYCGDWSGAKIENSGLAVKNPIVGIWGNALLLLFKNFIPPVFPQAARWNESGLDLLPQAISTPMLANFEPSFHVVGEIQTEESAGIGFGISMLALVSLIGVLFYRAGSTQRREMQARHSSLSMAPGHAGWSIMPAGVFRWSLLVAPWISLMGYCVKCGMVDAARLVAPYYPLLFPLLLAGSAQSQIVRTRWWRALAWLVLFLAFLVLAIVPTRPLWPAESVLSRLVPRHPGNRQLARAQAVYTVFRDRSDPLAQVRALLPPNVTPVGFMGTEDDIDISLWRPLFHRRVEYILVSDSARYIRDHQIEYIVAGGFNLGENHTTLEDWLAHTGAELVASTTATQKLRDGPQPWYVVRLPPRAGRDPVR